MDIKEKKSQLADAILQVLKTIFDRSKLKTKMSNKSQKNKNLILKRAF